MEQSKIIILAIDDIEDNLISLKAVIKDTFPHAIVFTANSGKDGIEIAKRTNPDVILLDIVMPEMDGYDTCRKLKSDHDLQIIPVVFITALRTDKASRIKALETGADGFLTKPIDEQELIAQIKAMVKLKSAEVFKRSETEMLSHLVEQRTDELNRMNQELQLNQDMLNTLVSEMRQEMEQRLQSEAALSESEFRIRSLIDAMPDFVCFKDGDGRWLMCNEFGLQLFQLTGVDYQGKTDRELAEYSPFYHQALLECDISDERAWEMGSMYRLDEIIPSPDGKQKIFDVIKLPSFNPDASRKGLIIVGRDITDRVKIEADLQESYHTLSELVSALHKSENLFQKVFEILPIGLWIADKAGKLLSSNEAGRKIWGAEPLVSQEEYHVFKAKRLPSREDVAPEDWALGHTVHKGVTIKDEMLEIEAFDGEKKIILNYTAPVLNEDGQIQAAIVINQDITEQFRNDMIQKLQSNIARAVISIKDLSELFSVIRSELAVLFDTTNFVYATYDKNTDMLFAPFEVDEKGDITSSWKAEKSLTGYMLAKRAPLLLSQEQMNALYASGEVNLVGVPSLSWMGVPLFKGDTISGAILVQSYNNPNAYEAKSLEVLEIIAHEMSIYIEKKESEEEALKLSRAIIQSPVSVVITDLAGSIVFANPKFCTVTGYTNAEAIGSNPRILKSGNHNDEFYRNMWQTLLSGCDWQGEMLNKKKDGSLYWESVIISPILNDRGDIIYYVGIKEDITEKKMMLEELIKAKDKAEESDRLKTGFLQNMSHEIRTPMHGILGFTSLLEQDNIGPKEVKEFASYIRTSGNRMMELINNILDISKIESGEVEVIENKVELIKVMQDLQNLFKPLCDAKGLALSYQLSDELKSAKVITDELKVIQIMSNLISNAVKFTDAGDITFSANLKDNHLEFKVVDTGCGVPEKHRAHIFDRFYQADMSMARGYEGAGLGLSICLGLVNLLGGQISFETVEDLGSTFIVNLPVQVEHSALPKVLNTPPDPKINGYIVLVAEDDDINYYYLSRVLKTHNFRVLRALNGQEAIDLVSSKPEIDLILMDIKMPVMNGLQATKIIREQHPNLPIIAQTAYAFDNEKANAMEAGCTEYLTKPINSSELFSCIEKVMRIKQ